MATQGFNYGVDFVGGHNYQVKFNNPNITTEDVRPIVDKYLGEGNEVKTFGTDMLSITTKYLINSTDPNTDAKVQAALIKALNTNDKTKITSANIVGNSKVDPTIANGLKKSAALTVIFAIIIISAYNLHTFP